MRNKLVSCVSAVVLSFGSFTAIAENLGDVYQLALRNDPVLKSAAAARDAALEARPQSRALLYPALSFSAGYDRTREDVKEIGVGTPGVSTFDSRVYALSLNQPLFNRDYFVRLRQADATVAQADAVYHASEQDLIVRVAAAYFGLLAADDNLEFARAEKNAIEQQLEQAKQRFDVGLIAITDVHEAQAAFDLAKAREIVATNQLASSREALYEITAQAIDTVAPLGARIPLASPDPADIEHWGQVALEQNFALLAAQFAEESARQEVSRQRAGHYPTLDLTASLSRANDDGGVTGETDVEDRTIGLQFTLPLYLGGAVNSRTREAAYRLTQAREDVVSQRRAILRQTRDAYLAVVAGINSVNAFEQARVSAQSALDATQAGFDVGTRTTVDVLAAQRDLFAAQREYAQSRYDYILNLLRLKQASGLLVPPDVEEINRWLQ
ncbi:MAG: TolC family outer membrane protein [Gammaproteobacteria bacterium]|nr:TolC family outer membrane protein [Gammaproteobacteria bacterium]